MDTRDTNDRKILDEITGVPEDIWLGAMPASGVSHGDVTVVMKKLSQTCRSLHRFFELPLSERALYQAVIDDNQALVKRILDAKRSCCSWIRQGVLSLRASIPFKNFMLKMYLP